MILVPYQFQFLIGSGSLSIPNGYSDILKASLAGTGAAVGLGTVWGLVPYRFQFLIESGSLSVPVPYLFLTSTLFQIPTPV